MADTITVTVKEFPKKLFLQKGESFFRMLRDNGLFTGSHCGGIGKCGRCRIRFLNHAPMPTPSERKLLSPQELRQGIRLACVTKPVKDCEIELCFPTEKKMFVLDKMLFDTQSLTKVSQDGTMIITDLGSTTIAMLLVDKASGQVIKSFSRVNPQREYGSDVISRIKAGLEGAAEKLSELVMDVLREGISELGGKPHYMALAGNTCMIYLLLKYPLAGLAQEPFTDGNREEIVTQIGGLRTFIMPGISAFVGGDVSAGIYASLALRETDITLLLDLGTNGEIALIKGNNIYVTATAAGPAFEGRTTLWGTDMVSLVAELLKKQIIDSHGTFEEPYFTEGYQVGEVNITQEDIRAIQLAKAAIRTGIEMLCKQSGVVLDEIGRVELAGGFGYYIDKNAAGQIGLIPELLAGRAVAVGNTALLGLFLRYREYSEYTKEGQNIMTCIQNAKAFNLARLPEFEKGFVKQIDFSYRPE